MNIATTLLKKEFMLQIEANVTPQEWLLVVAYQAKLKDQKRNEMRKAWEMYCYCQERGKGGGRQYICKYNSLTKQIEEAY